MVILEQVPGILKVDGGAHLHEALARLRDAGYVADYRVRHCNRSGDRTSRRRVFVVAIQRRVLRDDGVDLFPVEPGSLVTRLVDIVDKEHDPELIFCGNVKWTPRDDGDADYDGPVKLGVVEPGGIGHHVYSAAGPAITQKTWGEGPGRSTGLYKFPGGIVRRLSPWEAMRCHSFPEPLICKIQGLGLSEEQAYRLVGNSIPVMAMRKLIEHVLSIVDHSQIQRL